MNENYLHVHNGYNTYMYIERIIYIYICREIYTFIYTHIYMCTCIYMYVYIYVCIIYMYEIGYGNVPFFSTIYVFQVLSHK